ncbi:AAA family ATPase [Nesterenkonia lutea]|uniref:MoxR-like ATPase n=1 Tax=Nesterenkonia lutea TaxID=272919 RepID=A0ABR9JIA3_9MICC|nr:MoxR-like ATPase [Nesterenkonia lutea]
MNQGVVFKQQASPKGRDSWSLTSTSGAELLKHKNQAVRLVDLALWFGREVDVETLTPAVVGSATEPIDKLIAWFRHNFYPDRGDLIGTLYSTDVPDEYRSAPFADAAVDEGTYELLGSRPPAPVVNLSLEELVGALETTIGAGGYVLPAGLVRRVLVAWMRGDLVVLVGQPGTGKSLFANLLGRGMESVLDLAAPLVVPIRADFDEAEFIGYERLDGSPEYRDFARSILRTEEPLEARVVVLEEFNLAAIETYLSSVLVATQDQERLVRLPAGQEAQLPIDAFIIATCNSYRDEPETRARVSSPTKRRSTIITMSNVLGDRYDEDPANAVTDLATDLILAERKRIQNRADRSAGTQFDGLRLYNLNTVDSVDDFSDAVRTSLKDVTSAVLETPTGRSWFTMGLLRDVVLNIAHAPRSESAELEALGHSVADKILHQVRGSFSDVEAFRSAYANLPNAEEIDRLMERMMDGPSDELLSLL